MIFLTFLPYVKHIENKIDKTKNFLYTITVLEGTERKLSYERR